MKRLVKKSEYLSSEFLQNIKLQNLCWDAGRGNEINDDEHSDRDIAGIYFSDGTVAIDTSSSPAHSKALNNYMRNKKDITESQLEDMAECYFMGFKNQLNSNPLYYIFIDERISPINNVDLSGFKQAVENEVGGSIWILDYYRNRLM